MWTRVLYGSVYMSSYAYKDLYFQIGIVKIEFTQFIIIAAFPTCRGNIDKEYQENHLFSWPFKKVCGVPVEKKTAQTCRDFKTFNFTAVSPLTISVRELVQSWIEQFLEIPKK